MPSLDQAARDYGGVSLDDERLVVVHLLLYGLGSGAPSLEDACEWARHYGLDERANHVVLVGDPLMLGPASHRLIPGLQLVGADFRLRLDAAGRGAPHDLWRELWPAVGPALAEVRAQQPLAR